MTQATQSDSSRQTSIDKTAVTKQVAAVGVGGNVALSAIKLIAGIMGNSTAMISDAIHSLSDVFATAIAFIGVRLAERDADATHPYGHERFECVASLMLGLILAGTGLAIGYSSIETIATRSYVSASAPTIVALAAAVLSIVVKEGMFWYTRHWARVLNSSAFMADAWHHRSDAISSIGALLGIGASHAGLCRGRRHCQPRDLRHHFEGRLRRDERCPEQYDRHAVRPRIRAQNRELHRGGSGRGAHRCARTRKFGNRVYVDAEIAVDGQLKLIEAHEIAEAAHDAVEAGFEEVKHIMIHENPA